MNLFALGPIKNAEDYQWHWAPIWSLRESPQILAAGTFDGEGVSVASQPIEGRAVGSGTAVPYTNAKLRQRIRQKKWHIRRM